MRHLCYYLRVGALAGVFTLCSLIYREANAQPSLYGIRWDSPTQHRLVGMDLSTGQTDVLQESSWMESLAIDVQGDKLYWASEGDILRSSLDGSEFETILDEATLDDLRQLHDQIGTPCDHNIALDLEGGKIYSIGQGWCGWHSIRANLDGSDLEWLEGMWGVALDIDRQDQKVYWATYTPTRTWIKQANLDGSGQDTVTSFIDKYVSDLRINSSERKMYWLDQTGVFRVNLDGSDGEYVVEYPNRLGCFGLDPSPGKIYFFPGMVEKEGDDEPDSLYRANLDGSALEAVLGGIRFRKMVLVPSGVNVAAQWDEPLTQSNVLLGAYPNPFNRSTTIYYSLPKSVVATVTVSDLTGRQVRRLYSGTQQAGIHELVFDAADLPSGVYFYRLEAGGLAASKGFILTK